MRLTIAQTRIHLLIAALAALLALPLLRAESPALVAPGAPAAESPAPADETRKTVTLASLIESLRSPRYQERQAATFALLRLPTQSRSDIENALARETDPEAVERLTRVAVHLLLKAHTPLTGPVTLLGVSVPLDSRLSVERIRPTAPTAQEFHSAVVVADVQPGFPAAEVIQPGDRILAIDDQPFPADFSFDPDFRDMIRARRAGSLLDLTILRDGKMFKAAVQLAGLQQADPGYVNEFVANRLELAQRYVETLKTGLTPHPLVINDDSPIDPPVTGIIIPIDR